MQVVMDKCFHLSPKKNWHRFVLSFREKRKNRLTVTHSNSVKRT